MAKNTKYPLRINIGFLLNQNVGASRDFQFEFERIAFTEPDIQLSDFSGTAHISRTRQGLLVDGQFSARTDLECVRCLGVVDQALQTEFQELYAFKNHPISESGLIVPEDGYIDLGPVVAEYMVIEIPINPVCKEDCKGLCPVCGANLNEGECEHVSEAMEE